MSTQSAQIHVAGSHTLKREPELVNLTLSISDDGPEQTAVLQRVKDTSHRLSEEVRQLAPPKADGMYLEIENPAADVDEERREAGFPVSSWKMQQLRTWHTTDKDERPPAPVPARRMMVSQAEVPEKTKTYHAATTLVVVFHDFEALGSFVDRVSTDPLVSVENLSWRITSATRAALQKRVRHGAWAAALQRAEDYASAMTGGTPRLVPVEVHDDSGGAPMYATAMRMNMASHGGGGGGGGISFEPEAIEVRADVRVQFQMLL